MFSYTPLYLVWVKSAWLKFFREIARLQWPNSRFSSNGKYRQIQARPLMKNGRVDWHGAGRKQYESKDI